MIFFCRALLTSSKRRLHCCVFKFLRPSVEAALYQADWNEAMYLKTMRVEPLGISLVQANMFCTHVLSIRSLLDINKETRGVGLPLAFV